MKQCTLLIFSLMIFSGKSISQTTVLEFNAVKSYGKQLEDVMEVIDTSILISKLNAVEADYHSLSNELNSIKRGIIYHEVALNLAFFSKSKYDGYAQKSYNILSAIINDSLTSAAALPYISAYQASALSLISAETRDLSLLKIAFKLFDKAVLQYGTLCYLPEFLRGSVAENLPKMFFRKRRFAKLDFESIIKKQSQNPEYANWKIMSFTYWAWANQHQSKRHRKKALIYLDRAIQLDPHYHAARRRAEILRTKLNQV